MGGVGVKRVGFVATGRDGEVAVESMKGRTCGKSRPRERRSDGFMIGEWRTDGFQLKAKIWRRGGGDREW
jgi:hypothetical protein